MSFVSGLVVCSRIRDLALKAHTTSFLADAMSDKIKLSGVISWQEFESVDLRAGTVIAVDDFPEARKPAYKVTVDFGPELGIRRTSAQITIHYTKDDLIGRQVIGVVNFPPKQIGPVMSEFLLVGFYRDGNTVILAVPDKVVPNGAKLA